jgi:D-serine deaminase-like pyridoxal phosphate-dependent protein
VTLPVAVARPPRVRLPELDTPAVLIDRPRYEANLRRMAECVRSNGLALRPHAKTHKSTTIGRRQIELGAIGVTVAKPDEAMVFWTAGFSPVFLAYPPIGDHKLERLRPAIEAGSLIVGLDDLWVARQLGEFATRIGAPDVPVMFETDVGMGRTGLAYGGVAARAAVEVGRSKGLRLAGIYAHEGHAHAAGRAHLREVAAEVSRRLVATAELIRAAGQSCDVLSAGTCLTAWHMSRDDGLTEVRPGTYVFNDVRTVVDGGAEWDQCAVTVLATVISRPDAARFVIDAGAKTLTTAYDENYGFGLVLGIKGARLARLSEEHGVVTLEDSSVDVRVGDRVSVIPIHVCVAVNMQHELYMVEGDQVLDTVCVDAGLMTH